MDARSHIFRRRLAAVLVLLLVVPVSGCVGLLAHIGYWAGGGELPPDFKGLDKKRVAVICVSDSSSFGLGTDSLYLARTVGMLLKQNLKESDVVRPDEIADWIDRHDWNEVDFAEVGRGVKADMVVAVELSGLTLYDGQTLYRGRANLKVRVLDLSKGGEEVFSRRLDEISFPTNGAYASIETSENKFRSAFLQVLAERVARLFYSHEIWDDYLFDPASLT